jgi:hypothetical protein
MQREKRYVYVHGCCCIVGGIDIAEKSPFGITRDMVVDCNFDSTSIRMDVGGRVREKIRACACGVRNDIANEMWKQAARIIVSATGGVKIDNLNVLKAGLAPQFPGAIGVLVMKAIDDGIGILHPILYCGPCMCQRMTSIVKPSFSNLEMRRL